MATQTGSIDLRTINVASTVATKFVTDFNNGILVHPENDINNGVNITDQIEMIRNGQVVAKYGSNVVVGNENTFHIKMGVWYKLTDDTSINPSKTYYIRTETISGSYKYVPVETPVLADIRTYYEQMPQELGFYDGDNKVAYVRNDKLFIEQSVVVKQMDVGLPFGQINPSTGEVGLGQWSWKVHPNSENPKRNNLYLKWIG